MGELMFKLKCKQGLYRTRINQDQILWTAFKVHPRYQRNLQRTFGIRYGDGKVWHPPTPSQTFHSW